MHLEAPPESLCFGVTLNLVWQEGTEPDGRGWWGFGRAPPPASGALTLLTALWPPLPGKRASQPEDSQGLARTSRLVVTQGP